MTGADNSNQMTPSDADLFATLTRLTKKFGIDYGILHTCTLDSMGHRFGHDCGAMDHACAVMDSVLAVFIPRWLENGYEVIVTADHGQSDRGHHGRSEEHTSELQSRRNLVCRLLLEKKKDKNNTFKIVREKTRR